MAKSTTPRKKKTVRASRRTTGMAAIPTDSWNNAKFYTHYEVEGREWGATVKDWFKKHLDKKKVAAINKLPEWKVGSYSHWACVAQLYESAPHLIPKEYESGFKKWIEKIVAEGEVIAEEKKVEEKTQTTVIVPTIQERITEQAQAACEAIEEWLDSFITDKKNFDPKSFDFVAHFTILKVSQAHARKIQKYYKGELDEARLIVKMPTPQAIANIKDPFKKDMELQLREGYGHLTKKEAKTYLDALETLDGACMMLIDASKANRKPRAKKAPSKDKLVAKLKYKISDDKYQLVSVNPLDLIASTEIWVFNIKTRKLGKYVAAEDATVMTVNGTTLVGFDESKSIQKTLRKPEDTLKEFKAAGKIKLRRFIEDIATTDTKLTGRINADTVLLKATK
jgi:hypothetical protein